MPKNRPPRIGIVFNSFPLESVRGDEPAEPVMREFLAGLRDWGRMEGRNLVIERRTANGKLDQLESIARDLAALPVDVIVVSGNAAALAAKRATDTVPIVVAGMGSPVEAGLVASLAHPGGNITGTTPAFGTEMPVKRLELLRELLPGARKVVYLGTRPAGELPDDVREVAIRMRLSLVFVDAQLPDIDAGLRQVERESPDALLVAGVVPLYPHRRRIVEFAARTRLPDVYAIREAVEAGGLASYGGDSYDLWRRTARYVHRILSGARPAELPVEKTDRYWLVLNRSRARALAITIPQPLLRRADEVIE